MSSTRQRINEIGGGTLLAVVLISGNYLGELLPCEIQKKMQNRTIKYIILLFSIWYFISGGGVDASIGTIVTMFCAFGLVLLLTKTHWGCFILVITLLFVADILRKCQLLTMSTVSNVLAVILLLSGFVMNLNLKMKEVSGFT